MPSGKSGGTGSVRPGYIMIRSFRKTATHGHRQRPNPHVRATDGPEGHEIYDPCGTGSRLGITRAELDKAIQNGFDLSQICSPLVTPKQLGSIQKIQVAALKDFLCCADFKAPQPLRRQLPAGERGLNITFALSAARMLPQGASAGNTPLTATTPSREKANKPAPQGWLVCNI